VAAGDEGDDERAQTQAELDVDTRFLLANERTLLAWVRTALTLLAAGVGVHQFGDDITGRLVLASLIIALAAAAALLGPSRYAHADRAIRSGTLPTGGRAPELVGFGVALIAVAVLVGLLLGARG
jgi:putative membrane protein